MKVFITEPTYKHAMAIARYLKAYDPTIEITALSNFKPKFPKLFARHFDKFLVGDLKNIAKSEPHDLLIPVGNSSVEAASKLGIKTALLPPPESIQIALNKSLTLNLAEKLGIPTPQTFSIKSIEEVDNLPLSFPCVVKGIMEAGKNVVSYPNTLCETKNAILRILADNSQRGCLPIIQEYIPGTGLGFFGLYQAGTLKRFYMHQRLREFPVSGGASTAAKTIYHPQAFAYGKKLLDHLQWHGPAMVEFKYDPRKEQLALMEINPKFWGSTELGLAAGVNFGELLARMAKGEQLAADHSPDSYKKMTFYWPFEGDLAALWQTRNWRGLQSYWTETYATNVKANGFWLNFYRLYELARRIF